MPFKKLSPSLKNEITADWNRLFPSLAVLEPMWLGRRVGPLVQGVCLDTDSGQESYYPTTHIHCLCKPFPVISLSLGQDLLSKKHQVKQRIRAHFHEDHYLEEAPRLRAASLLPLEGDLTLSQVLEAIDRYVVFFPLGRYSVPLMEDGILLCVWTGQAQRGAGRIEKGVHEMRQWPAFVMERLGGIDAWRDRMRVAVADPEVVRKTAESQAHEHRVEALPMANLVAT